MIQPFASIGGNAVIGDECYLAGQVGIPQGVNVRRGAAVPNAAYVIGYLPEYGVIFGPSGDVKPFPSTKLAS